MRRLRRRPVAIRTVLHGEAIAAAGNDDPRQFLPRKRRAVTDVVRIVRGQAGIADLVGKAEPPEDFHGAGGDVVAFRLRRLGRCAPLDDRDVDPAPRQIDRQRQPDRPGAHDQHIGGNHLRHRSTGIKTVQRGAYISFRLGAGARGLPRRPFYSYPGPVPCEPCASGLRHIQSCQPESGGIAVVQQPQSQLNQKATLMGDILKAQFPDQTLSCSLDLLT